MQGAIIGHFYTIMKHKYYVCKYCMKFGLVIRGIKHDASKFSFVEFWPSVKYYTGNCSPQIFERKQHNGYSYMSVHHVGRNTHHWQYYVDMVEGHMQIIPFPENDLIEMFCDSLAASIVYSKKEYTRHVPYEYFVCHMDDYALHPASKEMLEEMFMEYEINDFKHLNKEYVHEKYIEIQNKYEKVYRIKMPLDILKIRKGVK